MRVLRSLSVLALLVPGLLAAPALTSVAGAAPAPVAPAVQELAVAGVDSDAPQGATPAGPLRSGDTRTVLLTRQLDTRPFAVVGLTWAADPAVGTLESWVRTRSGGSWSAWQELGGTADEQPDTGTADTATGPRGGTSPLWVDDADGVQVRLDVLSGADPRDLRLSLVDPGESAADATDPAAGQLRTSSTSAPVIRSRAAWGADESIRKGSPSYASSIHAVTLHHTASSNDYTEADVPRLLRGFYAYHVKSNGWSDLGYNFVVDKFGRIWEGRAGGTTKPVIGSHAGGFNTGTVGISVIGTYESVDLSAAAKEAVAQIAGWRLGLVGKDPAGTVNVYSAGSTRYPKGTLVTLPRVYGHRDVSTTACPGVKGMAALPGIRTRAKAVASGTAPAPAPAPSPTPTPAPTPTATAAPAPAPAPAPPPVTADPAGLTISAPATVEPGATVPITVSGGAPGAPVQVWFSRRGDPTYSRRREGVFDLSGRFGASYLAGDDYTVFAVSGERTSNRTTTRIPVLPPLLVPAPPTVVVAAPPYVDAGEGVPVVVTGKPGAAVDLWLRRRGERVWTRVSAGRFTTAGRWTTTYAGVDDHEYFATADGLTSADTSTVTVPVVTGPTSAPLGSRVELAGRARPGDAVVLESRRRGSTTFSRTTLTADATGAFRSSYAADDEYEYRALGGGRTGSLHRTTVRPTVLGALTVPSGSTVALSGTARPGAQVEVLFRRAKPSLAVAGRRLRSKLPIWSVGRVVTAGPDGRWTASYTATGTARWYARSDGNRSATGTTTVR